MFVNTSIARAALAVSLKPFVAISMTGHPVAFAGDGWKFKTDAAGNIVMKDGKPTVIKPDGTEIGYDIEQTTQTISRLTNEVTTLKAEKTTLAATVAKFADLDPDAARDALDKVGKIKDKKLFEAGEVDTLKDQIAGQWKGKLTDAEKKFSDLAAKYNGLVLGSAFTASKFVKDKLAIPPDVAQAFFGSRFTVDENGKITAKDASGTPLMSSANIGNPADFEEAIEAMVKSYPNRNSILKGTSHSGGGGGQPNINEGGKRVVLRKDMEKLSPAEQAKVALEAREGKTIIQDSAAA